MSVDVVKRGESQFFSDCKYYGKSHDKGEWPAFGKTCNCCGGRNHFEAKCSKMSKKYRDRSHRSQKFRKCDKCGHCKGRKVNSVECNHDSNDTGMEDLAGQVQSLFYY